MDSFIAYNLTDILTHELGHLLGLHHLKESQPDGSIKNICDEADGIMGTQIAKNDKSAGLTNDDQCMFKKIYCPNLVPIEDEVEKKFPESEVFPNPFEDKTQISFTVNDNISYVILSIYDNYGRLVKNIVEKYYDSGEHIYTLDAKQLSSGCYFYVLKIQDLVQSKQMLLIK